MITRNETQTGPAGQIPAGARGATQRQVRDDHSLTVSAASIVGVLTAWSIASVLLHSKVLLPSPIDVAVAAWTIAVGSFQGSSLWTDIWVSTVRVLTGYFIGVLLGLALGFGIATNTLTKAITDPILELLRPIPPLAWIPLLVVWFGIGELPKILLLIMAATPLMAIATAGAIDGVRKDLKLSAQSLGANGWQVLLYVVLPASLPGILTGARLATAACWSSLVAVEMIAAESGLGWLIWQASNYLQTSIVFVGIVLIATIALVFDRGLRMLESRLVPWRGRV